MDPARLIKVVAAFVSGVVIALGSALIYVRVSDMLHPPPLAETNIAPPEPPPAQLSDPTDDLIDRPSAAAKTAPDIRTSKPERAEHGTKKTVSESHRQVTKAAPRREQAKRRAIVLAQNHPSTYPPLSSPPPAVSPVPAPGQGVDPPSISQSDQQQPAPDAPQAPLPAEQSAQDSLGAIRRPHVVTLPPGTTLIIRLGETVSTDHNYTGDTFRAALESPVIMDGFIIADTGSKVLGRVAKAQRAGRVDGLSDLVLTLIEINTTDRQRVRIDTTSYDKRGPASSDRDTAEIAGGAALGALIGAAAGGGRGAAIGAGIGAAAGTSVVLATRGRPAVLPLETRLTFHLATPVTITEKFNY